MTCCRAYLPAAAFLLAGIFTACQGSPTNGSIGPVPTLTPSAGKGTVTGGLIPCAGIPNPSAPRYAGGSVTVLKGRVTWRAIDAQSSAAIFPLTVAGFQNLAVDQTYVFSLDPGDYVLRATFPAPANVQPWTTVTVKAGVTTHIDIPNQCK